MIFNSFNLILVKPSILQWSWPRDWVDWCDQRWIWKSWSFTLWTA